MGLFGRAMKGLSTPAGSDLVYLLGATLKDISGGGSDNFLVANDLLEKRREQAKLADSADAMAGLFGRARVPPAATGGQGQDTMAGGDNLTGAGTGGAGNPGEMGGMTPELMGMVEVFRKNRNLDGLLKLFEMQQQAQQPTYKAGDDGWYKFVTGRDPVRVTEFATKPDQSPWIYNPDGSMTPRKNGPADPAYIRQTSDERRAAIVANPTPIRSGGGRGGGRPKPAGGVGASARPLGAQLDPNDGW